MDDLLRCSVIQKEMAQSINKLEQDNDRITDWNWVLKLEAADNHRQLKNFMPVYITARKKYYLN